MTSDQMGELADRLALAADKPELLTTIDLQKVMIEAVRALRFAADALNQQLKETP